MTKEKSKFPLNKGGDHNFDISKGGKRKFDLTKDIDEPVETVETTETSNSGTNASSQTVVESAKSEKKWVWIIAALAIICVIVGIILSKSGESEQSAAEVETVATEEVVALPTATDSIADEPASEGEATSTDEATAEPASDGAAAATTAPTQPVAQENATTSAAVDASNDVEAEALKVIRGDYGIGQERKDRLGSQYQTIQKRVNELKREGIF